VTTDHATDYGDDDILVVFSIVLGNTQVLVRSPELHKSIQTQHFEFEKIARSGGFASYVHSNQSVILYQRVNPLFGVGAWGIAFPLRTESNGSYTVELQHQHSTW
jgi:hypothetical protein